MIFNELDEWSYDLEQDLKNGNYTDRGKLQKKIMKLQQLRDKYHQKHIEEIRLGNLYSQEVRSCPRPKHCIKRWSPKPPGSRKNN